jgi:EAL domain-containing protein (putative c-di-GMP-specific phosphodiesterase class I)
VNLSLAQLRRSDLADTLCGVLEESGLETRYLDVEVPEGVFVGRGHDHVYAALEGLHRRGVGIALDHFGTGSVSLMNLRHWPVDRLKIDSSFVGGLQDNPADAAVVDLLIRLGSSLGLDVIAGGVETTEQSDFLRRHGCQLGQGYLFARPSSGEGVSAFLPSLS